MTTTNPPANHQANHQVNPGASPTEPVETDHRHRPMARDKARRWPSWLPRFFHRDKPLSQRPLLAHPWRLLKTRLKAPTPSAPTTAPLWAIALVGLGIAALLISLSVPWLVALLIALPVLTAVIALIKNKIQGDRAPTPPTNPERSSPDAPLELETSHDESKSDSNPGRLLMMGLVSGLLAMMALGCAFSAKPPTPVLVDPYLQGIDPILVSVGKTSGRVWWNKADLSAQPGFPLKLSGPKNLNQPGGLRQAWSGTAGEAVAALAKALGYLAWLDPRVTGEKVQLKPDPRLSPYDHLRDLTQTLRPKAGVLIDPINRILILKSGPWEEVSFRPDPRAAEKPKTNAKPRPEKATTNRTGDNHSTARLSRENRAIDNRASAKLSLENQTSENRAGDNRPARSNSLKTSSVTKNRARTGDLAPNHDRPAINPPSPHVWRLINPPNHPIASLDSDRDQRL